MCIRDSNNIAIHKVGYPAGSFYVYEQVYNDEGRPIEGVYVDQNADGAVSYTHLILCISGVSVYTYGS